MLEREVLRGIRPEQPGIEVLVDGLLRSLAGRARARDPGWGTADQLGFAGVRASARLGAHGDRPGDRGDRPHRPPVEGRRGACGPRARFAMTLTVDLHHHVIPDFYWRASNEDGNAAGGITPPRWSLDGAVA